MLSKDLMMQILQWQLAVAWCQGWRATPSWPRCRSCSSLLGGMHHRNRNKNALLNCTHILRGLEKAITMIVVTPVLKEEL